MALKVGDNFSYQGAKPNFERDTFSTLNEMKSFPTTSIDEGHISLCLETGKRYKYSSSNSVDANLGKWRLVVDTALDATSENPVQNKVVYNKFLSDELEFAKQIQDLSKSSSTALNNLRTELLNEDKKNKEAIENEIVENERTTAAALGELKDAIEENELVTAIALNDKVGQSRTINGYDLSEDIVLTKADVGLDKVNNTSDAEKPVSNPQQAALDGKVDKRDGYQLISSSQAQKLNDLPTAKQLEGTFAAAQASLEAHTTNKENPHEVTKAQVGLGNVDNTADLDKPISTKQQAALDKKVDKTTKVNGHTLDQDVNLTKSDIGLSKVDNTSDEDKPLSKAAREAFEENEKIVAAAISEIREDLDDSNEVTAAAINDLNLTSEIIKNLTINGHSVLDGPIELTKDDVGLGNVDNTSGSDMPLSEAMEEALKGKVDKTTTVNGHALTQNITLTKTDVSLGKVDNTSDLEKPVSTAQQAALDKKVDKTTTVNGHPLSGNVTVTTTDLGLNNLEAMVINGQVNANINKVAEAANNHALAQNNPHKVTKTQLGLGNVDNTADMDKPISNPQREYLEGMEKVTAAALSELGRNKEEGEEGQRITSEALGEIEASMTQLEQTTAASLNSLWTRLIQTCPIWKGTQAEYNAIPNKSDDTLYLIIS